MDDPVNLELWKRQRAAFKGQLTAYKSQVASADTLGGFESILHRIRLVYDKYDKIQNKLEAADETTAPDRVVFEDEYGRLDATLLNKIHDMKKSADTSIISHNTSFHDLNASTSSSVGIRLPEITLPSFSGLEIDWLNFRDIFIDLIHSKTLEPTVKFLYLISSVRSGKAYELIESLSVTAPNYQIAWTTLCDKYNNEIVIQRYHVKELYDLKSPQEGSARDIQHFIDKASKHYNALKSLKVDVSTWDLLLVHHLTQKLDKASRVHIVKNSKVSVQLSFSELIELLRNRIRILNVWGTNMPQSRVTAAREHKRPSLNVSSQPVGSSTGENCFYCKGPHSLPDCPTFSSTQLSPKMRFHFIKDRRLCGNCLKERHPIRECNQSPCGKCTLKHHILLHFESREPLDHVKPTEHHSRQPSDPPSISQQDGPRNTAACSALPAPHISSFKTTKPSNSLILLGTALIHASSSHRKNVLCRALLDSGSTMNFITTAACDLLKAHKIPTSKIITGINAVETVIRYKTYITISSCVSDFSTTLKFYILSKITQNLPSIEIPSFNTTITTHIKLADPYFNVPDRIDLLLGAEIYHLLFKDPSVQVCSELPPLQNSVLGYVICGKVKIDSCFHTSSQSHVALCSVETLETQVKRFWELENLPPKPLWSKEETSCEEHYVANVSRSLEGRYTVALPTKPNLIQLGHSQTSARYQFFNLERRLTKINNIYEQYRAFMTEYISMGHMVPVNSEGNNATYFIPHHHVIKETSSTTKLRVVFNASSKTSSHLSLNDCLMVGPTVQSDLHSILLRFRMHQVAFCGDIAKMYRQILIREDQQNLQRIYWRNHDSDPLQQFALRTVTYGTASAPFLATRTLNQLASDEQLNYPTASTVLNTDFYVDDVLTGAPTVSEALHLKSELIALLSSGGFELRKFSSNVKLLASTENSDSSTTLVLGLLWNTTSDQFEIQLDKLPTTLATSKRTILSEICQLFDPLGLCAPIILTAKLFMQSMWLHKEIGWDDNLPLEIIHKWKCYKHELSELQQISYPRLVGTFDNTNIELHGFCDASEKAYGCVLYTRTLDGKNQYNVHLLCAKTRVSPLKKETIPRLELCAAVLLAEVINKVATIMNIPFQSTFLWSDSKISLFRIKSEAYKYATFVANRITKIQELTSPSNWFFVKTAENPADLASRGIMPSQFTSASLWWNGPQFLKNPSSMWSLDVPQEESEETTLLELRPIPSAVLLQQESNNDFIFHRFHSYSKLLRVVAYIRRFFHNARHINIRVSTKSIHLQPIELTNASMSLIKLVQDNHFSQEINSLKRFHHLPMKSPLQPLAAFLDREGLLRVGGRLVNATICDDQKHPVLLPGSHVLSSMIANHEHIRLLHAGPQALLYNLRLTYWITGGRNLCRKIVHSCVRCFHVKPQLRQQIMGDLPFDRVNKVDRPFTIVGIDFCGPFTIKPATRSKLFQKCYVCLFICFVTKAVHLELVMDSSTQSFLACLKRFVSRRGVCTKIHSDNATNFIGARSELADLRQLFLSQSFIEATTRFCANHNIIWNTIPPRSPHFGGLWESAIKLAKHHLTRVIGLSVFTTEEFLTLIAQVESCLNSRPLTPMSSDPSDLSVLSPGHFLIGSPLTALPEPSLIDLNTERLSRFQKIQQCMHRFWDRWHAEYLSELQHRNKWTQGSIHLYIGALVLLHDDNLPPLKWNLGRITALHPGKDGIVRVVTIKTASSVLKRAVNRISLLPLDESNGHGKGQSESTPKI